MSKKSIVTWIGVVSGLITILLVFYNPFKDKASLVAYIQTQEILTTEKRYKNDKPYDSVYIMKVSLKNNGELLANKIHVNNRDSYRKAVVKIGNEFKEYSDKESIYIDRLEAGSEADIFYWGSIFIVSHYTIDRDLTISSVDTGKAELRSDIKGDNIIWYIEKYFIYFAILPLLLFLIAIQIWGYNSFFTILNKEASDKSDLERKLKELNYAWSIGLLTESEYQEKGKKLLNS